MSTEYKVNNGNYSSNTDLINVLPVCEFFEVPIDFNNSFETNSGTVNLLLYTNSNNYNVYPSFLWSTGYGSNIYNASNSTLPPMIYNKIAGQFNWMVYRNNTGYDWTGTLRLVVVHY